VARDNLVFHDSFTTAIVDSGLRLLACRFLYYCQGAVSGDNAALRSFTAFRELRVCEDRIEAALPP
jgi:hypothetical protein